MLLKQSVDLLVVSVPEIALPQQIQRGDMVVGQGDELVGKKDGVGVVVHVQVVDGELVEPFEDVVGEQLWEGVELGKVVLGVLPVIGLQELGEEKDAVGLCGCEDGRLWSVHLNRDLN